jgi:indolepyruvate ferredoxin oxidoreductase alpha subunit
MGDGTFFHSGIAPLINAVYNKSNPLVLVLDNRITAMTGHQQNPGEILKIEDIVQACGVKNIKVIDQTNVQEFENAVKEFLNKDEISVIVCRKICALLAKRQKNG